jgi:tryptophan halogenase
MKYTIIGGGTAGWLTALYVKHICPKDEVVVVASSEIGILGAGEGTTPQFVELMNEMNIPISDIIKNAKGTFKNGIKFTNWNGDGGHYYHGFQDYFKNTNERANADFKPYYLNKISSGDSFNDINLTSYISEKNQVKIHKENYESYGAYALHFDANLLAKHLQSVGLKRNIKLIDGEVISINNDSEGFIKSFDLKSQGPMTTDFVFDCTGFKRLIIGQHYGSKWKSYKEHLPLNRALPFFIDNDGEELPPYTESIAMKHGWVWKIPVQGRHGCGYVFDSNFVSDEDIIKELEEYFGHKITSPRAFNFDPGCFEEVCVKNCVAMGLSSSFVEPLEATSIWVTILMLKSWGNNKEKILEKDLNIIKDFNDSMKRTNLDVLNFIHFHYKTKRNDSEFWINFSTKNKILPFIEDLNLIIKDNIIEKHNLTYLNDLETNRINPSIKHIPMFSESSWLQVGSGIKYYSSEMAKKILNRDFKDFTKTENDLTELFELESSFMFHHNDYIEELKNT